MVLNKAGHRKIDAFRSYGEKRDGLGFEYQGPATDLVSDDLRPMVSDQTWQWGSIALVARVPVDSTQEPKPEFWKKVKSDITAGNLLCKQSSPLADCINDQKNLRQVSSRWFSPSGMLNQFLVTANGSGRAGGPVGQNAESINSDKTGTECCSGTPTAAFHEEATTRRLANAGIKVAGVSRTRSERGPDGQGAEYVVLHLHLSGWALANAPWVTGKLHRYTSKDKPNALGGNSNITGEDLKNLVDFALECSGVTAYLDWGGALVSKNGSRKLGTIYTISTLVPSGELPTFADTGVVDTYMRSTSHLWAYALSTGRSATLSPPLSDLSEQGVEISTISLGPMVGWSSDRGLGLVTGSVPPTSVEIWNSEVAHSIALAHSVFVDLAVLTMQQDRFLKERTGELSNLAFRIKTLEAAKTRDVSTESERPTETDENEPSSGTNESGKSKRFGKAKPKKQKEDVSTLLHRYKQIQQKHIEFLGSLWLQEIPGRPSASRVLRAMQSVRMLEERIKHSVIEQRAVMDYLEAAQSENVAVATDRQNSLSYVLNFAAYIFLPATLIFTITGGLGIPLHWKWAVGCGAAALALTLYLTGRMLWGDYKRKRRNSTGSN